MLKNIDNEICIEGVKTLNRILNRIADGSELEKMIKEHGKETVDNAILEEIIPLTCDDKKLSFLFPFKQDDCANNSKIYNKLQQYTAKEALDRFIVFKWIANYLIDLFDTDYKNNSEFTRELKNYIYNDILNQHEEELNKNREQYIENSLHYGGVSGDYWSQYIDIEDNIGDKTLINDKIDLSNRDGNFIIIDGKVITGDDSATHSQLINEYIEKYLNQDINEDLNEYKVRDTEMFDQLSNDTPIAFGHIVNNTALIETCDNCTIDDAVSVLKEQCNFDKIYEYDASGDTITRLARYLK